MAVEQLAITLDATRQKIVFVSSAVRRCFNL
jgi:hypothetical protein